MALTVSLRKRLSTNFTLDIEFSAASGFTMLFGASGAGKTTVLKCIAGLARPDEGRVSIGARTLFDSAAGVDVAVPKRRVGYVFQHLALFPHMSVQRNLEYGLAEMDPAARRERAEAIAESFRIAHLLDRRPDQASGGERQRVALARSLVTDPQALLLDEPLAALDYVTQSRIIDDLRTWNLARNLPILYVTHSHREVYALAERVIVLEQGRLVADGTPHDVLQSPTEESVAQLAGFENFFDATVVTVRPDAGTMQCHLDGSGADLEVPLSAAPVGSKVRVAIRAGDILLANREPAGLSARNVLAGTIAALKREGTRIVAEVDAGSRFVVHLTPGAVESLELAVGRRVWLVVKTHSCRLLRDKID